MLRFKKKKKKEQVIFEKLMSYFTLLVGFAEKSKRANNQWSDESLNVDINLTLTLKTPALITFCQSFSA